MDEQSYPSPEPTTTCEGAPFYVTSCENADATADEEASSILQQQAVDLKHSQTHDELIARLSQSLQSSDNNAQQSGNDPSSIFQSHSTGGIAAAHLAQNAQDALNISRGGSGSPLQETVGRIHQPESSGLLAGFKSRTKVSRACDDCRRKKIKCDASTESGVTTCTACRKAGTQCVFVRQPQKRGPSKGYIKELADRVTTLEGQLKHSNGEDQGDLSSNDAFQKSLSPSITTGMKRSHSMLDDLDELYTRPARSDAQIQSSLVYDEALAGLYYRFIHPYLPFLPAGGSPSLRELIANIPFATRISLLAALECTMRSAIYNTSVRATSPSHAKADELVRGALYADPMGLPHLQALLLLAIDSANRGAIVIQGGNGPRPGNYIAQAMEEAKTLDLFNSNVIQRSMDENALSLARSIAMSVSVLDVVTALANKKVGSKPVFPSSITMSGDLNRVGTRLYWLGRAIHRLVDLSAIDVEPREGNEGRILDQKNSMHALKRIFITSLDEYKESSGMLKDSLLGLTFWYVSLHTELYFWPLMESSNLFHGVKSLIELQNTEQCISPFSHHFSGLAAHILFQLVEFKDTREQAFACLAQLDEVLQRLVSQTNAHSFDAAIRDSVSRRRALSFETYRAASQARSPENIEANAANGSVNGDHDEMHVSPADDGGVAAAAAAAAKAVQLRMGSAAVKRFSPDLISQEGYLYALLG